LYSEKNIVIHAFFIFLALLLLRLLSLQAGKAGDWGGEEYWHYLKI